MPAPLVATLAKKAGTTKDRAERLWKTAKAQAEKQGKGKDYNYITGIFKKMLDVEAVVESSAVMNRGTILIEAADEKQRLSPGQFMAFLLVYESDARKRMELNQRLVRNGRAPLGLRFHHLEALRRLKLKREALDEDAINELELFIDNDSDIYHKRTIPAMKNLAQKMAKGNYNPQLATKMWLLVIDDGAKAYNKEFGGPGNWFEIFPKPERMELAQRYARNFEQQVINGEWRGKFPDPSIETLRILGVKNPESILKGPQAVSEAKFSAKKYKGPDSRDPDGWLYSFDTLRVPLSIMGSSEKNARSYISRWASDRHHVRLNTSAAGFALDSVASEIEDDEEDPELVFYGVRYLDSADGDLPAQSEQKARQGAISALKAAIGIYASDVLDKEDTGDTELDKELRIRKTESSDSSGAPDIEPVSEGFWPGDTAKIGSGGPKAHVGKTGRILSRTSGGSNQVVMKLSDGTEVRVDPDVLEVAEACADEESETYASEQEDDFSDIESEGPAEEDIVYDDRTSTYFQVGGKKIGTDELDVVRWMEQHKFWPNVWFQSDHGNVSLSPIKAYDALKAYLAIEKDTDLKSRIGEIISKTSEGRERDKLLQPVIRDAAKKAKAKLDGRQPEYLLGIINDKIGEDEFDDYMVDEESVTESETATDNSYKSSFGSNWKLVKAKKNPDGTTTHIIKGVVASIHHAADDIQPGQSLKNKWLSTTVDRVDEDGTVYLRDPVFTPPANWTEKRPLKMDQLNHEIETEFKLSVERGELKESMKSEATSRPEADDIEGAMAIGQKMAAMVPVAVLNQIGLSKDELGSRLSGWLQLPFRSDDPADIKALRTNKSTVGRMALSFKAAQPDAWRKLPKRITALWLAGKIEETKESMKSEGRVRPRAVPVSAKPKTEGADKPYSLEALARKENKAKPATRPVRSRPVVESVEPPRPEQPSLINEAAMQAAMLTTADLDLGGPVIETVTSLSDPDEPQFSGEVKIEAAGGLLPGASTFFDFLGGKK